MKSIWTITLNVLVRIGRLTQCAARAAKRAAQHMYSATKRASARAHSASDCAHSASVRAHRASGSAFASALKAVLVCALSVAMLLPVCLTAETAVAAENANNSANTSANPDSHSGSKPISNPNPQPNPQPNPPSRQGSVSSQSSAASDASSSAASDAALDAASSSASSSSDLSSFQSFGSNNNVFMDESSPLARALRSLKSRGSSPLARDAKEAQAKAQNREVKNYSARESYEVYRPGCNKDYALGACITTDGDGAGLRATNGHDLDVNSLGYNLDSSDPFIGAATRPRGHYENGPVPEDPSGTDHYGATYFTPYPKGTFIMGRFRNMAFNHKGSGVDRMNVPVDDTADFVFVKRTPKLSGGGFVWDIIFNAGGRTQGAGAAFNYFTIPKGQILDKGSEGGRQYIQRVLYNGREDTALYKQNQYKKNHGGNLDNYKPPRETCSFSWDNPNGLCSKEVKSSDFAPGDDLTAAWGKMKGSDDSKNGNYSRLLPSAMTTTDLNSKDFGKCRDGGQGLDCIKSSSYAALDEGDLRVVPKVEGSYNRGYSPAYVALVQNLYQSIKNDTQRVFGFVNNIKSGEIAYTYKIHFTTTTSTNKEGYCAANKGDGAGCENFSFFYAAGSYFGHRDMSSGFYGATDPFGKTKAYKYSMTNFGRDANLYMYTIMHQQWYGAPRIMDIQAPRYHFLKGTGLGPYNSDSGNYLKLRNISFSSVLLGIVNKPLGYSSLMNESEDIRLLPDYYSPNNGYARGNQWFRNPGMNDHNTKDSTPGRHKLELRYNDRTYHMSETQDLWYRIITQADVFKPLQTEEYDENNKTPKYYSYDQPLPNPLIIDDRDNNAGFVNFVGKRSDLYKQVMAFDPNLFPPVNQDDYGTRRRYGSIKQKKGAQANNYPLDASYLTNNPDGDSNTPLKNLAVYKAEWTNKWGDEPRSNTLQDADLSVAAKVPIVSVVNPCGHSKILDEYKDKINGQSRSSVSFRSVDGDEDSAVNDDRAALGEDREDSMPECWPKAQDATKRNVWFVSDAPKTGDDGKELKPGDPVKQDLQDKVLAKIKRIYRTWMRNKYSAQLQNGKDPKVLSNYVFVKYVKITFWDNSTTVIPVVFPYVDYEKPTLDVKVSVNNGNPVDVPADGLKIPVDSKIKFWVKGHDDKRILLGVKPDEATEYFTNNKNKRFFDSKKVVVRNDFDMITTNRDKKNNCDTSGCGDFTTISYDQFIHKNGELDNQTDQVGWVINSGNSKDEGSPTVLVADQTRNRGVHDLIFHGWDAAGNSVIKKLRLIIVSPGYGLPNVWWDKKPNGHYVGRVNPWDEDKRVRSIMVRIWARGQKKPGNEHNYDQLCPKDGSCYGIVIQRDGNKKTDLWHQVNTYKHNNDAASPDGSRAAGDRSAEDRAALEDRDAADDKSADGKAADGKAADSKAADGKDNAKSKADKSKADNKAKAGNEKTENAKPGEKSTQNQQKSKEQQNQQNKQNQPQKQENKQTAKPQQENKQQTQKQEKKQEQQIQQSQVNNKPASLKISKELKKNAKNKTAKKSSKKNAKKRNIPGRRGKVRFAVLKEDENKSTDSKLENKQGADQKTDQKPSENAANSEKAANSETKNVPNKNVPNNGNEKQNKAGDTNASTGVNKDAKKRSKRSTQNKDGKNGNTGNTSKDRETSKDGDAKAKEDAEKQDRDAEDEDRSTAKSNDDWRKEYSKRIITAKLGDHIKGCTTNGDDKCEITFDPVTGNITIPEYFAEIGSRIYVDVYSVSKDNPDERQNKLWKLMDPGNLQDREESDPLPLDIAWPNGLVQVNPFELNNNEIVAMLSWMRHDKRNERIFGYRKEEIGVKDQKKYDTYDQYDNGFNPAKTQAKYAYGEDKPQYSCDSETGQQWKLCLGGVTGINAIGDIKQKQYAKKTLAFKKLEADDETILNPIEHKVTRFVDMRKDYTWGLVNNNKKSVDGRNDPGFDGPQNGLYGNQKYGTQYFVYKWNINSYRKGGNGRPLNLQDVLKLVKGTPNINKQEEESKPQPSLTPMSAADNKQFDAWNGSYPMRGDGSYGFAIKDNICSSSMRGSAVAGKCQWRNKLNLVKYTPKEFIMDRSSFSYDASVNMKNGREVHITDRLVKNQSSQHIGDAKEFSEYAIHKDFLMPGGEDLNGQADGENIGDVITKNIDVDTMNDYDAYGEGTSEADGYANNRPFTHAQLYVNNGQVTNDLLLREPGKTPDNTTNVINVWFMPVDNEKPTISAKSYQEWDGKPWDIHGRCMLNGDVNNCSTLDDDVITLDKKIYADNTKAWYEADNATINLPAALKLDDDFNEYEPGKCTREWKHGGILHKGYVTLCPNSINSKVLVSNLNIYIKANNIQDSSGKTSSPMLKFVSNGVTNKHLLRRFIEKYRSTDMQNPSVKKQTVFTMYAETTDSAGKQSDKTVVGCFKATWTDMVKPSVVAYDGKSDENAKYDSWLSKDGSSQNRDYKVVVKSGYGAKRMVVYYHPASELQENKIATFKAAANAGFAGIAGRSREDANKSDVENSIGKTISICWDKSWSVCSGTSKPREVTLNQDNDGNAVLTFPSGFLAPGSVVRARSRLDVGPWTYMPGVRSPEDLADDSGNRDGNKTARSSESGGNGGNRGSARAAKGRNAKSRAAKGRNSYRDDASSEDTLDVLPMAYAKEKPSEVCRPDYWSAENWSGMKKPSDCVYFGVKMNRQIVQIHPMLLSGHEERAIRMDLRSENNFANQPEKGIWLPNDSEIVTNEDPRLGPGRTMVTFRQYDYDKMTGEQKPLDQNLPNYGDRKSQVGNKQDVAVLTRGWRSRVLVPNPQKNKITRFVRLRAESGHDNTAGGNDYAADYLADAPTSFKETEGDKALRVKDRPYDPGFVLSKDKKSLLYLYNASTKRNFTLNDLQSALKLKRNGTLHPATECGTYVDGSKWDFADCQPSLLPEVKGSDKVDGEHNQNGFSFDGTTHFYTYNPSEDHRSAANGADNDNGGSAAAETWYVNVIDMISKGGTGGGYKIPNSAGVTSESSNTGLSLADFANIGAWGRSGAIDSSLIGHKVLKNPDNDLSVIMTYGDSWVGDTHKTRGKEGGWNNDANYEFVMPVYLIPVDNEKPTVAATAGSLLSGHTDANNPYVVTMEEKDYSKLTVKGNPVEYEDGKVSKSESKESGKTLFADVHDDYDSFGDLSNRSLVACKVSKLGKTEFNTCKSIMSNNGAVDTAAFKKLKTDGNGVEYALYGHAKDKSDNESDGFGDNNNVGHLVGYFSFGYLVRPVALPYSGGQAAIWFSFMFGVLLALFLASGAFGRRGWLSSVLSGNGFGALTDSKHCDASSEALRSGKLFKFKLKWLRR
ncbi:hypothetical protein GK675_03745 [Bifidobacteriaceae bacterium NR002]|nr:hypothetical protein [Bifidobacteriaceae bacterium NR002]MDZ7549336.1 hypothetical protein [Bifidobacteriaceae bacterium NR047]